jgi:hypothetical protein
MHVAVRRPASVLNGPSRGARQDGEWFLQRERGDRSR